LQQEHIQLSQVCYDGTNFYTFIDTFNLSAKWPDGAGTSKARATVQNDLAQALSHLAAVQRNLQHRAAGLIKGGIAPTVASVKRKCEQILHRQHWRLDREIGGGQGIQLDCRTGWERRFRGLFAA